MRRRIPLPISVYAGIMAGLGLLAFIAYAGLTYRDYHQVRKEVATTSMAEARRELHAVMDGIAGDARRLVGNFAAWEEVRQQLRQPQYYAYWRNHRMLQAGVLSDNVQDAEIYTPAGRAVARSESGSMPANVGLPLPPPYIEFKGREPYLLVFSPVLHDGKRLGYVAIAVAFLERVRERAAYRYLDPASVLFAVPDESSMAWTDFVNSARFGLRENPMGAAVEELLAGAILHLSIFVGLFILLLFPSVVFILVRPLRALSQHVDRLRQSRATGGLVLERLGGLVPIAETEKIKNSLNDYQERLHDVHCSLQEKSDELWRLAQHDALTGAKNRRAFEEYVQNMPRSITDRSQGICFALFDVNHFKAFNDTYGHQVGDALLKMFAGAISSVLRRGDELFRIGGDEFAVLLIDCSRQDAVRMAERCDERIAAGDYSRLGLREPVRASVGLAFAPPQALQAIETLQWQADVAMHYAKRPGHSHIVMFRDDMAKQSEGLFSSWVNSAVMDATTKGQGVSIFYQPIVDTVTGGVAYYESLLRIRRGQEWILPRNIFPVVEARRMETDLDRIVLEHVYMDLASGHVQAGSGVSVNLSGPTVVNEHLVEWLAPFRPLLADYRVVLEVTETALITQIGEANFNLSALRRQGFEIALDDFGSGYSSIRYLANMPVDTVKFDISLVQLLTDPLQRRLVENLVGMIKEAGHKLVAEGVETPELTAAALEVGFAYAQGYLFGKPERVPGANAGRHLRLVGDSN